MSAVARGAGASALRSGAAILAGLAFVAAATTALDQIFHATGVYPPWGEPMREAGPNLLALAYRVLLGVGGGWIAARLAPRAPMVHALALGAIGTVLGILGALAAAGLSPAWFLIAVALAALPAAYAGGTLVRR